MAEPSKDSNGLDNKNEDKDKDKDKDKTAKDKDKSINPLDSDDISILSSYGSGPYSLPLKVADIDITRLMKSINNLKGIRESDTGLSPPSVWDLHSDRHLMQSEQPLQVARCTKIINPGTENAQYMINVKQIAKYVVGLGDKVSPTDIEEGMRVGVDRSAKIQIQIPLPPRIDPSVTMMTVEEKPDITYQDVGGCREQIEKIREVVEMPMLNPERFIALGIDPPKGVLLYGRNSWNTQRSKGELNSYLCYLTLIHMFPLCVLVLCSAPGTGKTLLARAVANQTDACFIRVIGSELVQKYVGEGARMVRELFQMARSKRAAIVFFDEIDAIGGARFDDGAGGDNEVQRTMLQIVTELDGFDSRGNVKVLMATNRPDTLDPALLRPGRLDRKIEFNLPDLEGRTKILNIHSKSLNCEPNIRWELIARLCPNTTGAELRSVCIAAGSPVGMADGTSVPIEDVHVGDMVLSHVKGGLEVTTVTARFDQGVKECVELLFSDGCRVSCTEDHRFLTEDGSWVQAKDLQLSRVVHTADGEPKEAVGSMVVASVNHPLRALSGPRTTICSLRDSHKLPLFCVMLVGRRRVGFLRTYDLSVSRGESFVVNGLVVHNCTEAGMFAIRARRKAVKEEDLLEAVQKVIKGYAKFSATPKYMVYN